MFGFRRTPLWLTSQLYDSDLLTWRFSWFLAWHLGNHLAHWLIETKSVTRYLTQDHS